MMHKMEICATAQASQHAADCHEHWHRKSQDWALELFVMFKCMRRAVEVSNELMHVWICTLTKKRGRETDFGCLINATW